MSKRYTEAEWARVQRGRCPVHGAAGNQVGPCTDSVDLLECSRRDCGRRFWSPKERTDAPRTHVTLSEEGARLVMRKLSGEDPPSEGVKRLARLVKKYGDQ